MSGAHRAHAARAQHVSHFQIGERHHLPRHLRLTRCRESLRALVGFVGSVTSSQLNATRGRLASASDDHLSSDVAGRAKSGHYTMCGGLFLIRRERTARCLSINLNVIVCFKIIIVCRAARRLSIHLNVIVCFKVLFVSRL